MTPQELIAYIEGLIIDNATQQVTPYKMRAVLTEMVNSLNQSNISSLSAVLPLQYDAFTNTLSLPVINNLTAGGTNSVLSAEQGKVLKQLIDDLVISGGGIPEAPIDGTTYGRKDGAWEAVGAGAVPTLQEVTNEGNTVTDPTHSLTLQANGFLVTNLDTSEQVGFSIEGFSKNDSTGLNSQNIQYEEITSSETLTIPNESGTLATQEYVSDLVKSNLILYPTTASSDIGGYAKLVSDINDADYNDTAVDISTGAITGSNILISSLASAVGILSGEITQVNVRIVGNIKRVSGTANGTFYFEIYHRDSGGTETLIGTSDVTEQVSSSSYVEFSASALITNENFNSTDRLVYKFYGNKVGGGSNPTFNFQFGGATPVRILTPVPASLLINDATPTTKGISKLYTGTGTNEDGGVTQKAFTDELNTKQSNAKPISTNYTALNNDNLIVNATCTISDVASPSNGTNYEATIINGSVTIGGVVYGMGVIVKRIYNSGSWKTCVVTDFEDWTSFAGTSTITSLISPQIVQPREEQTPRLKNPQLTI